LGIADLVGLFEQPTEGGDAQGISSTTLLNTKNRVNITCSFLLVGGFPPTVDRLAPSRDVHGAARLRLSVADDQGSCLHLAG
jgi:hypothetical protein